MKPRLFFHLLLYLAFSSVAIGQETPGNSCGFQLDSTALARLEQAEPDVQKRIAALQASALAADFLVTVPIKFYVIRQSDGTGGLSLNVSSVLSTLNGKFAGTGLYFTQCGSTQYIDNTTLYNFNSSQEGYLLDFFYTPGVINLYFANTVAVNNSSVNGYAYPPNTASPDMVVIRNDAASSSTVPHEIGHFFGLLHTHKLNGCPASPPSTDEWVNGCNKWTTGDLVGDTPADPGLLFGSNCQYSLVTVNNSTCAYNGGTTYKDANNQPYNPQVNNLMSYAPNVCRTQFTQGQKDRIAAHYQLYRSYLSCGATSCSEPLLVYTTYVTNNAARLNWSTATGAVQYEAQIRAGNGAWSPVTMSPAPGNFVVLNNLSQATTYRCRVRTVCDGGTSNWKESSAFTTLTSCNTPVGLYSSDITSSSVKFNWSAVSGASLYTIVIRRAGTNYWVKSVSTSLTSLVFTNGGWGYIEDDEGLASNTAYEWSIRSNCSNGLYSDWSTPQLFSTTSNPCNSPAASQLVLLSSSPTSLTIKCNTPGVSFRFRRQKLGGGDGGYQVDGSSSNTRVYTNLDPCTTYEVQCQVKCQDGVPWSTASASQFFTTSGCVSCNSPAVLTTASTTYNSATLSWSAVSGASSYALQWRTSGGAWSDLPAGPFGGTSATIYNLVPGGSYEWRIRTNCSNGQFSGWSGGIPFNTPTSCAAPLGPKAIGITQTAATLLWGDQNGAMSYTLQYQPAGGGAQEVQVTSTTKVISGLSPNTTYTWKVRANCGVNQSGPWQSGVNFTTLPTNSLSASPLTQNVTSNAGSTPISVTANISWNATVNSGASWLSICPISGVNNGAMTATCSANTSANARTATVTIVGGGITKTVSIVQAGNSNPNCSNDNEPANNTFSNAPALVLNTDKLSQIGTSGDEDYWKITLNTPQNLTVSLSTLPADYDLRFYNSTGVQIGSSLLGGTSSESIPLPNQAAGTYYARVYGYNGANSSSQCYTLKVTTSAASALSLSPSNQNVGAAAGSTTFSISANIAWTVSDNTSWLSVSPASGSNNATLTASFTANTSSTARTAIITVTGSGITQTATVVQAGVIAGCATPTGLQTSNITQNTATLGWNSASGAISYQIQFLLNGAWTNIGSPTTALSMGIYGLTPNNSYQWRVITICANGQQSVPSTSLLFYTPTVPNCTGGNQWPSSALTPTANWQSQSLIYGGEYCLVNVQSGVTYTFSYCSADGALLSFDGQLSIRNVNDQLLSYSDDFCGLAPKITWQSNITGQVRVLLSKYNCQTQATNSTMVYRIGNNLLVGSEPETRSPEMSWQPLLPDEPQPLTSHTAQLADDEHHPPVKILTFPNPAPGAFNIQIENTLPVVPLNLRIFDQLGRIRWKEDKIVVQDQVNIRVDASAWANGMYVLEILTDDGRSFYKKIELLNP